MEASLSLPPLRLTASAAPSGVAVVIVLWLLFTMKSTGNRSLNYERIFIQERDSAEVERVDVHQPGCGFESRRPIENLTVSF